MKSEDCGPAVVLVYGDGRLESALLHKCDGGEAYMGPLLRKAVQYAKTHYDSGNILDVLMSEGEMLQLDKDTVVDECAKHKVRHVYYMAYWWDATSARKTYRVWVGSVKQGRAGLVDVAQFLAATSVPTGSRRLV